MNKEQLKAKLAKLTPAQRQALLSKRQSRESSKPSATAASPSTASASTPELTASLSVSNAQTRMWMFEKFTGSGSAYNIVSALHLCAKSPSDTGVKSEPIALEGMTWAFNQVIARHEILRSGFIEQHGQLKTDIQPQLTIEMQVKDLKNLGMPKDQKAITEIVLQWAAEPINLSQTPLVQLRALRLQDDSIILVMLMHHIIADGWSLRVLEQELSEYYAKWQIGEREAAQPLAVQYKHYVGWESEWLASKNAKLQQLYWKKQLATAPEILALPELSGAQATLDNATQEAATYLLNIDRALSEQVEQAATARQLSPFMMYLAAFKLSLAHYSGVEDLVVGTPVANRRKAWLNGVIGLLSNSVALRSQPQRAQRLADYLQSVRQSTLGAFDHQELPFEKVVESVNPERHQDLPPVFQVLFALQATEDSDLRLGDMHIAPLALPRHAAEFPLTAEMFLTSSQGFMNWTYQTARFNKAQIDQLASLFTQFLTLLVHQPDCLIEQAYAQVAAQRDVEETASIETLLAAQLGNHKPVHCLLDASLPTAVIHAFQALPVSCQVCVASDITLDSAPADCSLLYVSADSDIATHANTIAQTLALPVQKLQINPTPLQCEQQQALHTQLPQLWLLPVASTQKSSVIHAILRTTDNQLHLANNLQDAEATANAVATTYCVMNDQQQPLAEQLIGELVVDYADATEITAVMSTSKGKGDTQYCEESSPSITKAMPSGRSVFSDKTPTNTTHSHRYTDNGGAYRTGIRAVNQQGKLYFVAVHNSTEQTYFAGQRINLSELNQQLQTLSGGAEVVTRVKTTTDNAPREVLIAYVVPNGAFDVNHWQQAAQSLLKKHGVFEPIAVVVVSQLPINKEGQLALETLEQLTVIGEAERAALDTHATGWYWETTERQVPTLTLQAPDSPLTEAEPLEITNGDHPQSKPALNNDANIALSQLNTEPLTLTETSAIDLLKTAAAQPNPRGITSIYSTSVSTSELIEQASFLSYAELYEQAIQIAAGLQANGVQAGDVVALQLYEVQDILLGFWGATLAGAVILDVEMPTDYRDPDDKDVVRLQHALDSLPVTFAILPDDVPAGAYELLTTRELQFQRLGVLNQTQHVYRPVTRALDDTLLLLLTSGSTGKPKVVTQTHGAVCLYAHSFPQTMQLTEHSVCFNWMPLQHVGGIVMCHATLIALNAHQIHCPTATILQDPLRLLAMFSHYRASMCWSPNFAFALINEAIQDPEREAKGWNIREQGWDLSAMQILLNGGEAVVHSTVLRFVEQLMTIGLPANAVQPIWGMSETCSGTLVNTEFDPFVETDNNYVDLGGPIRGLDFRVVDGNDTPLPQGRSGRLQARGGLITKGYYNNAQANQSSFTKDGWFTTGDLAVMREGSLAIVGREKDLIIINGLNYHGLDIEQCIEALPTIMHAHTAACAVRRAADDTDKLCVFYAAELGVADDHPQRCEEIRQLAGKQLGVVPSYLVPLPPEEFPRTSIGKIQRSELAQRFMEGEFDQQSEQAKQQIPAYFHRPVWKKSTALNTTSAFALGTIASAILLVITESQEAAAKAAGFAYSVNGHNLADVLTSQTHCLVDLRAWHTGDLTQLTEPSNNHGLTAIWQSVSAFDSAVSQTLSSDLPVETSHAQAKQLPYLVVCQNAYACSTTTSATPTLRNANAASLIGAVAAIGSECTALHSRWLSVCDDPSDTEFPSPAQLLAITAESLQPGNRPVLLAGAARWQQVLQPCFRHNQTIKTDQFAADNTQENGIQVVVGGFGGIGQALIPQLLAQGLQVAVMGRRKFTTRAALLRALADQVSITESGSPLTSGFSLVSVLTQYADQWRYYVADACNEDAVSHAFAQAHQDFSQPIGRVFYLAGANRPALLGAQHFDDIRSVISPKVQGIQVLQQALEPWPNAAQVHFSSSTAILGGKGFHAYSVANAYQQAFCEQLAQQGKNVRCLLWSMWQQLGMSQGAQDAAVRAAGYHLLTASEGLQALQVAATLPKKHSNIVIGVDALAPAMQRLAMRDTEALYAPKLPDNVDEATLDALPKHDSFGQRLHYLHSASSSFGHFDSADLQDDAAYQTLKQVWESVLQQSDLSPEANFFALGGDSILAIQAVARAAEQGVFIQPRDLFEQQTLLRLRGVIADQQQLGEQETIVGDVALMPMQQWFFDSQLTAANHMNQSVLLSCQQPLNSAALQQSLHQLVTYHDGLRAHFQSLKGGITQQYQADITVPLQVINVASEITSEQFEALIFNEANQAQAGLDITQGPLLRAVYFHSEQPQYCRLFLAVHHLIVDGVSWRVLVESLMKLYSANVSQTTQNSADNVDPTEILGPKSHSIRQWIESIERYLQTSHAEVEANHWRLALQSANAESTNSAANKALQTLPTDLTSDNLREHETQIEIHFSKTLTDLLFNQLPYTHQIKADDVLLTALAVAFERCTGSREFSVLMEGHGRELPEGFEGLDLTRTIGWFTSMYPLYLSHVANAEGDVANAEGDVANAEGVKSAKSTKSVKSVQSGESDQSALHLAQRIFATHKRLSAVPHGGVTFQWLRYLGDARQQQLVAGELPGISYNYLGKFDGGDSALFGFAMEATGKQIADSQQRLNDIDVLGRILNDQAAFSFIYSRACYSSELIQEFADHFQACLDEIAALSDAHWQHAKAMPSVQLGDGINRAIYNEVATHFTQPPMPEFAHRFSHILPSTPLQLGLIFETLLSTGGTYVSQLINEISGNLQVEALRSAWQDVINTHSIYRTGFVATQAGQYLQVIERDARIPFTMDDWRQQTTEQQEAAFEQLLLRDREQGFDFEQPPLLRITLVQMADQRYRMLMSEHHAVCDGWSRSVILAQVAQSYRRYAKAMANQSNQQAAASNNAEASLESSLEVHAPQYADYVYWLQRFDRHSADAYWASLPLAQASVQRIAGQKAVTGLSNESAGLTFVIDQAVSEQAQQAARTAQVTLNAIAQAAWALCLRVYCQSDLLVFATTHSGRPTQLNGVEQIVGPLINTLPVVADIHPEATVQAFVQAMQHQLMQITEQGYVSVSDIGELHQRNDISELQQSLFVFENFPLTAPEASDADDLHIDWVKSIDSTEYPLTISIVPEASLKILAYYLCDYFDAAQVQQICRHYQQILSVLSQQLTQPIAKINWLSDADEQQIKQQHTQLKAQQVAQQSTQAHLDTAPAEPADDDDVEMFEF